MSHHIAAIVIKVPFDAAVAERFDVQPIALTSALTMFLIDHYYTAYWQSVCGMEGLLDAPQSSIFPSERVVLTIVRELTKEAEPSFAVIMTDYFGGAGSQWAAGYIGERRTTENDATINDALKMLGVVRTEGNDEFDTVGLGNHRRSPDYLDKYSGLCDERGV